MPAAAENGKTGIRAGWLDRPSLIGPKAWMKNPQGKLEDKS
jgi:hypothetical protein